MKLSLLGPCLTCVTTPALVPNDAALMPICWSMRTNRLDRGLLLVPGNDPHRAASIIASLDTLLPQLGSNRRPVVATIRSVQKCSATYLTPEVFHGPHSMRLDEEMDLRGNPCSSPLHVLKALCARRADAGIVGERLWHDLVARKAPEVETLQAVWTSPSFSHCVFTAARDFDKTLAERFTRLMLAMDDKDECTAEILRLESAGKWVAGSPDGFETLIEAIREQTTSGPGSVRP
jgi:hypothetical protein